MNEKMGNQFSDTWQELLHRLKPGEFIPNWTELRGNLGDLMQVIEFGDDGIVIQSPNAKNLLHISRDEFEKVWEIWPAYKAGRVQRRKVSDMTFHSKYILSILHWLEENKS